MLCLNNIFKKIYIYKVDLSHYLVIPFLSSKGALETGVSTRQVESQPLDGLQSPAPFGPRFRVGGRVPKEFHFEGLRDLIEAPIEVGSLLGAFLDMYLHMV